LNPFTWLLGRAAALLRRPFSSNPMQPSNDKLLRGTVSQVHGPHIFIESGGVSYYASRQALNFLDPHIGLIVTFRPEWQVRFPVGAACQEGQRWALGYAI
jgi:hypothetical protein